ncbi:hypothetical protein EJ02DRAFT_470082 [Clathrospora elynae]|uniref:Uncharacterized protein n=1 Tax=Clathrospora elynae TaxID=706981 RepID=A0A6A5SBN2_9PLEO|nr:hypothetical protein EJ02DRAFT_470082 [Clathrospora elynae]
MAVNLHLLTNNKGKQQRRVGQLEEYFESLGNDLTVGSEQDLKLLENHPWRWWLKVGQNCSPFLFKIATVYLSIPFQRDKLLPTIETGLVAIQLKQYNSRRAG